MSAEFATVIPAVLLILACCLGAVQVVGQQIRLTDAAADGARSLARGDGVAGASRLVRQVAGAVHVTTSRKGDFLCMTVSAKAAFGPAGLVGLSVSGSGCALAEGP